MSMIDKVCYYRYSVGQDNTWGEMVLLIFARVAVFRTIRKTALVVIGLSVP